MYAWMYSHADVCVYTLSTMPDFSTVLRNLSLMSTLLPKAAGLRWGGIRIRIGVKHQKVRAGVKGVGKVEVKVHVISEGSRPGVN